MKAVFLLAVFVVLQLTIVSSQSPCDVNLNTIKSAIQAANIKRQGCEKSFFSSADCDAYWSQLNEVLSLQINYQDCGRESQEQFYSDVRSSIQTQGDNTRSSVTSNAGATQSVVSQQASTTRTWVTSEADRTVSQVNSHLTTESTSTRNTVSSEATATRTLVSAQHTQTRALVDTDAANVIAENAEQAQTTRTTVSDEHTNTRAALINEIDTQGQSTRQTLESQANLTRDHIDEEHANTRNIVASEASSTRTTITSEASSTRATVSSEATSTRNTVSSEANTTRTAVATASTTIQNQISVQATSTRSTVNSDGASTRSVITSEAANTNTIINNGFNSNTASLNSLQAAQNNFTQLFIELMISMDFSSSASRVDLFQRPAAMGGYFETTRAVTKNVIDTNAALYGNNRIGNANTFWSYGESYRAAGDYRRAWESYRNAYIHATTNP